MDRQRVMMEDAAKHLLRSEHRGQRATVESLAGVLGRSRKFVLKLIEQMQARGLVRSRQDALELTTRGQELARHVLRAHRLWESYLADEAGVPLEEVHDEAERVEHQLSKSELDALADQLGHPLTDPHGDVIPSATGELEKTERTALTDWPTGRAGRIVHLEDEPKAAFAQIHAMGLRLGMVIRVVEREADRLVIEGGGRQHVLAPIVAACIHVGEPTGASLRDWQAVQAQLSGAIRLNELPTQSEAVVAALAPSLRGITRRRLMDLGLTPGTRIRPVLEAAFGNTRAYRVRGTTIALREEQARDIWVYPSETTRPRDAANRENA